MRTKRYKAVTRVGLSDGFWLNPVIALNRRKPPEMDRPTLSFQRHIKQESARYTSRVLMNLFIPFLIFFLANGHLLMFIIHQPSTHI